jgi:hypothetical protein
MISMPSLPPTELERTLRSDLGESFDLGVLKLFCLKSVHLYKLGDVWLPLLLLVQVSERGKGGGEAGASNIKAAVLCCTLQLG